MKPADVREVFESILPEEALLEAVRACGLQTRECKLDAAHPCMSHQTVGHVAVALHEQGLGSKAMGAVAVVGDALSR